MKYVRNILMLFALLTAPDAMFAQKVAFEVQAPKTVMVGEQFRVNYRADADIENFAGPDFGGIEVVFGPGRSWQRSMTIVDGETVSKESCIYTYMLVCNSPGEFKVTGASAKMNGKKYKVRSFSIKAQDDKATGYKKRLHK